jgi:hypothetical protein
VSYIESMRLESFDSFEDALAYYQQIVKAAAKGYLGSSDADAAAEALRPWLEEHLIENPQAGKSDRKGQAQARYCLDRPRSAHWAFMAWDVHGFGKK